MLDTFEIVVAAFLVIDKVNQVRFFKETFLVANISPEVVFGILFLTLSSANVDFSSREPWWRTYNTKEALPTTRRVELVNKKEFAAAALDLEHETYVVYVGSVSSVMLPSSSPLELNIHPFHRPQMSSLIAKKAPTKILAKYLDFADIFFSDLASKLFKYTKINDHTIELVDDQQPPFRPIYSLEPVELETLKAYIETNLANRFIRPSNSPANAPILFDLKSDGFFRLCVDYWDLNNLTIKNQYPFPLIGKLWNRLGMARWFTQLGFINAYHWMRIRKGDKWKTAFKTWYGHFKYQVMPFDLTIALASFQGYINKIFIDKLAIFIITYLHNLFIYTDNKRKGYIVAIW